MLSWHLEAVQESSLTVSSDKLSLVICTFLSWLVHPTDFPITEHMLDLAYKVECEAIIKDSAVEDKNDIDDLYLDLLELCTH